MQRYSLDERQIYAGSMAVLEFADLARAQDSEARRGNLKQR